MEHGSTEWTVIDSEETESTWQLGQPQNADGATAHSPWNAWGSDLTGASISQSETFLISPAVFLGGGNTATLRFWQYYDFLDYSEDQGDLFQYGEVLLITNENAAPLTLGEVTDLSDGWEEAEYDLTPYLGNVVYVVWHYFLLSMDYYPRTAWLVDDVSVTVTNTVPGAILVTNNLFQAAFLLNGPIAGIGQGNSLFVSNAPPGEYVVTYYSVPFYQTPPPQTNVLQSSNLLVFQGQYTFTDANQNGISDAWELQFLGQVAAVHPGTLDTDHDGMSDYAEFIAGTNPTNASSVLRLTATVPSTNGLATLTWTSVAGRGYRIVAGHDLLNWVPLTDWQRANNSGLVSQTVAFPANAAPTFYRLEVRP
ncbi:MAG: choice-of-anchor J domain-containing protein [Verrucomicrobia bacterium]|nr:choice-of-anchor J domain-containing protein [Verrucomicrobiota bacterium]